MSPAETPSAASWIVDVDVQNFEREVVLRSKEVPVVVDFWATWCEPCRVLGPKLEERARKGNGRFVLAKVDVDANPELAQAFRVQGIPAVLALVDGRLVDGFQGALPDAELDRFLDDVAPGGPKQSVAETARELAQAGDADAAIGLLREHLRGQPGDAEARVALAGILVQAGKTAEAKLVLAKLSETDAERDDAKALLAQIELEQGAGDVTALRADAEARPDDPAARLALGKALVAKRDYEAGLEEMLAALRLDPTFDDGAARKAMLEVFEILGIEDPVANRFRFQLSLELFS